MFRIGPLTILHETIWLVRGEKGTVTYSHLASLEYTMFGNLTIHEIDPTSNSTCEWNGEAPTKHDGKTICRMEDNEKIFTFLEEEYRRYLGE